MCGYSDPQEIRSDGMKTLLEIIGGGFIGWGACTIHPGIGLILIGLAVICFAAKKYGVE